MIGLVAIAVVAAIVWMLATGRFTTNGFIAVDRHGRYLSTLVDLAHERGLSAGIVTTSTVTHATPAAFTAHTNSRLEQPDIALQQAKESRPEVLLGGGSSYFLPEGQKSKRRDEGWIPHRKTTDSPRSATSRGWGPSSSS